MEDLQLAMHDFYNSCPLLMLSCADSQPKNSLYANAYKKQKSHVDCKSSPELTLIDIQWA